MVPIIESRTPSSPSLATRPGVRLVGAAPSLWRVLARDGRVIGHLQAITEPGGVRFRARRFHPTTHRFRDLGDFWNAEDAVDCLRFAQ